MSRPLPILKVPSRAHRTAFVRTIYAAGWAWVGETLADALTVISGEDYDDCGHAWIGPYGDIMFIENDSLAVEVECADNGVLYMNSPAQFVAYGRQVKAEIERDMQAMDEQYGDLGARDPEDRP